MQLGRGSSNYFTLVALVFADQDAAQAARSAIRALRVELGPAAKNEFKFNKMKDRYKDRFFETIAGLDYSFHSFTLNKAKLMTGALSEPNRMYRKVTGWTLENLTDSLVGPRAPKHATIIFDACGNREFYERFERFAVQLAATRLRNGATMRVLAQPSHTDELLQMADMVCGAINQMRNGGHGCLEYYRHVFKRATTLRFWPP